MSTIPGLAIDPAAVRDAAARIRTLGGQTLDLGREVDDRWQRLALWYHAPETPDLLGFPSREIVPPTANTRAAMEAVAAALMDYADAVEPWVAQIRALAGSGYPPSSGAYGEWQTLIADLEQDTARDIRAAIGRPIAEDTDQGPSAGDIASTLIDVLIPILTRGRGKGPRRPDRPDVPDGAGAGDTLVDGVPFTAAFHVAPLAVAPIADNAYTRRHAIGEHVEDSVVTGTGPGQRPLLAPHDVDNVVVVELDENHRSVLLKGGRPEYAGLVPAGQNIAQTRFPPSTRIVVLEHGDDDAQFIYETDAVGRVVHAEGTLDSHYSESEQTRSRAEQDKVRLPGERAGHLIPAANGGPAEEVNLVSQSIAVNHGGPWKSNEIAWDKAVKEGREVKVIIEIDYRDQNGVDVGTTRPESFTRLQAISDPNHSYAGVDYTVSPGGEKIPNR